MSDVFYQYKPDLSVKYSPRIPTQTRRLIGRVCRQREMLEADVLRFCLEAVAPAAAKRGIEWLLAQTPRRQKRGDAFDSMVTVRTSRRVKESIDALTERQDEHTEADVLRYCYAASLPIALEHGFSRIMQMRESNLQQSRK